jgi:outer membrane protein assembly factor BamA
LHRDQRKDDDEGSPERKSDWQAQPNLPGDDARLIESSIAGESGDIQGLSDLEEATEESVEELAASGQALEASAVEGLEDAADHPERPVQTHEDYGRPNDALPTNEEEDVA